MHNCVCTHELRLLTTPTDEDESDDEPDDDASFPGTVAAQPMLSVATSNMSLLEEELGMSTCK